MTQFTRVVDGSTELVASLFNDLQEGIEQQSFNVMRYGAVGDGVTDDYQAVQDALDAAGEGRGAGIVFFPPGRYRNNSNTSWALPQRVRLEGCGNVPFGATVGTVLEAGPGMTVDLMKGENVDDADFWSHGSQVINLGFFAASGQTSGSGLRWCPGENSELSNCSFVGFPEAGVRLQGPLAPAYFYRINVRNNKWGIWLDGDESTERATVQGALAIYGLSGDDNENLINIDNGDQTNPNDSGGFLNVSIFGIKAETSALGPFTTHAHNPLVRWYNANNGILQIVGGFITSFGNTDAESNLVSILENADTDARSGVVVLQALTCRGYHNLIKDAVESYEYDWIGDSDDFNTWRRIGVITYRAIHDIESEPVL